jgi:hypothetical protein
MGINYDKVLIFESCKWEEAPTYPPLRSDFYYPPLNVLGWDSKIDVGIDNLCRKGHLCISVLQESNVHPRFGAMEAGNQNDIAHTLDPQSTLLGEGEQGINVLHDPFLEFILRKRVFTSSIYWE